MANNNKNRKPLTTQQKGCICLAVLLALTIVASCFALINWSSGDNGMYEHRAWVPVSSENWPASLPVTRALGGGEAYEFKYTLPENASETAVSDTVNTIRNRLNALGEYDVDVKTDVGKIRVEVRNLETSRQRVLFGSDTSGYYNVFADGHFSFASGDVTLTEKDITGIRYERTASSSGNYTTYKYTLDITDEARQLLEEKEITSLAVTRDGNSVFTATVKDGQLTASVRSSNTSYLNEMTYFNEPSRLAYYLENGTVDVTLTQEGTSKIEPTLHFVLTVVLVLGALLLIGALAYLYMKGRLTGLAGFLGVWLGLLLSLFLTATLIVPTSDVNVLNTGCLVALLLGLLLSIYCAVTRTEAITAQVKDGAAVKQASKLGFSTVAKNLWIIHGAAAAVALLLTLFQFSKSTGYCLLWGVAGSALSMVMMRVFQYVFNMITVKSASYGGTK